MSEKIEDEAETLIIPSQPETEIYWGQNGHLVIKQTDALGNDDPLMIFTPGAVPELIRCLQEKCATHWRHYVGEDSPVQPPAPPQSITPPTPEPQKKPQKKKGVGS